MKLKDRKTVFRSTQARPTCFTLKAVRAFEITIEYVMKYKTGYHILMLTRL